MKKYIGIDPGAQGFIAVIDPTDCSYSFLSIADSTEHEISEFLLGEAFSSDVAAVLEDVHSIFGSSAKSTFNFGHIKGLLTGMLIANRIPYTLVQPKEWQGEIWTNADKAYKSQTTTVAGKEKSKRVIDTKTTSIKAAQRLFPSVDLRRNEQCRKIDDNKCDALLMAEYARRKNL